MNSTLIKNNVNFDQDYNKKWYTTLPEKTRKGEFYAVKYMMTAYNYKQELVVKESTLFVRKTNNAFQYSLDLLKAFTEYGQKTVYKYSYALVSLDEN